MHLEQNTLHVIQALRGVATILVVLYHATQFFGTYYQISPLGGFFLFGFSGVHLFFVLSGFIISMIHSQDIDKPSRYLSFIKKRFIRIYPIYWFFLAIISLWFLHKKMITFYDIYQNIFLLKMPPSFINQVCWTLSFEVFFYIIFSFLILNRILGSILMICWVVAVALTHLFEIQIFCFLHYAFHKYTILFMIGMVVSYIVMRLKPLEQVTKNRLVCVAFISGFVIFSLTGLYCNAYKIINWDLWIITLGFGLASGMLMICSLSYTVEEFFRRQHILTSIGDASFSTYLVHFFFLYLVISYLKSNFSINGQLATTLLFVAVCILTLLVGFLFYWIIERPLLKLMRNWLFYTEV